MIDIVVRTVEIGIPHGLLGALLVALSIIFYYWSWSPTQNNGRKHTGHYYVTHTYILAT